MPQTWIHLLLLPLALAACSDNSGEAPVPDGSVPSPTCQPAAGGGTVTVSKPILATVYTHGSAEGWLASPAVADLDGDGKSEVIAARHGAVVVWAAAGTLRFKQQVSGRIWSSPVVADIVPDRPGLELAVAARGKVHVWDATGQPAAGFPASFNDELRSLAAGDIDGDGKLELVGVTTNPASKAGQQDIIIAFNHDGSTVAGFPPNTSGASGCDDKCYVTGGYDQNVALGDMDGDGKLDILATQDNAYLSLHAGDGRAFDAAAIFEERKKWPGIRFLLDYDLAQQGWAPDEQSASQAHFTNSAPVIADLDDDGTTEAIVLSSVQNAAQTDRERGVALWVLRKDGTRPAAWVSPFHAKDYLAGLWDFDGTNVVAATNQVSLADLDPASKGLELVFAGFDGRIHCVDAQARELWSHAYTTDDRVLTTGVAVVDLSGDGAPEAVFASYSPDDGKSSLFVLSATGTQLHKLPLPGRGAMAVPTVADVDGDGTLEILVALKDGSDRQVLSYQVIGSADNCMPWPTGRGNLRRSAGLQ